MPTTTRRLSTDPSLRLFDINEDSMEDSERGSSSMRLDDINEDSMGMPEINDSFQTDANLHLSQMTTLDDELDAVAQNHEVHFSDYLRAQRDLKSFRGGFSNRNLEANDEIGDFYEAMSPQHKPKKKVRIPVIPETPEQERKQKKRMKREKKREENYVNAIRTVGRVRRRVSIATADNALWDSIVNFSSQLDEEEKVIQDRIGDHGDNGDNGHDDHKHHHNGNIPWYSPPMQRVFYGKQQVLPHVNWGDLFFDLFYVAAAYNLGALLISSMNGQDWTRGIIYFVGIFGALYECWYFDVTFSSRYTTVDHVHRILSAMRYFGVAVAIMNTKAVSFMSDRKSSETFNFTVALFAETLLNLAQQLEIFFKATGDRTPIRNHSRRTILTELLPSAIFYLAALVIAAISYYEPEEDFESDVTEIAGNGTYRLLGASDSSCCSSSRRVLGAADGGSDCGCGVTFTMGDVPLTIVLFSYLLKIVFSFARKLCLAGEHEDIRNLFVPNNLDYLIHRYGEWIMLMIGEGVLSLLIVETTESTEYIVISHFGILTVMGIHVLVFESQPSHSEGHAIYRSLRAQMVFGLLVQILSIGLIAFGVCFKIMLTSAYTEDYAENNELRRRLAGPVVVDKNVATGLFSGSLASVLITLELMLATHKGAKGTYKRLFKGGRSEDYGDESSSRSKLNKPFIAISIAKLCVIVFTATLSQFEHEYAEISVFAFFIVYAMLAIRLIGWSLVHKEEEIQMFLSTIRNAPKGVKEGIHLLKKTVTRKMERLGSKNIDDIKGDASSGSTAGHEDGQDDEDEDEFVLHRAVWDTSFDSIIVISKAGIMQYVNETALTEFQYESKDELVGNDIAMLVGGGASEHHHLFLKKIQEGKQPSKHIGQQRGTTVDGHGKQRVLYARRKDSTEFPCMIGLKELTGTNYIAGFIRNLSDLAGLENFTKDTFMKAAATGNVEEMVEILGHDQINIDEGDYDKRTALHVAAGEGHDGIVTLLCDASANVNVEDRWFNRPLDDAIRSRNVTIANILRKYGAVRGKKAHSTEIFIKAAAAGDIEKIKEILAEGVVEIDAADYDRRTALHLSASEGFADIVQLLCEASADANFNDRWGLRPLDDAERGRKTECVKILKKFGASRGQKADLPSFVSAAARGDVDEVKAIIDDNRVDINQGDYDRRTALHLATSEGHHLVVLLLCSAGADVNVVDRWNNRPLDDAERTKQTRCAEILREHGAERGRRTMGSNSIGSDGEILDEAFDAIVISDYSGIIKRVNQTTLDSFHYDQKDELIGLNISVLVGGEHAKVHDKYLEKFHAKNKTSSVIGKQRILYGRRKDGTEFPCIVVIKKIEKRNCMIGWIRDMSDLTDQGSITISNLEMLDDHAASADVNFDDDLYERIRDL